MSVVIPTPALRYLSSLKGRRARHLSRERGRNPSRSEGRGSRELSAGISLDKEAAGEMFEQFLSQKFRTQVGAPVVI